MFTVVPIRKNDILSTARVYLSAFRGAGGEEWTLRRAVDFVTYCRRRQPDLFFAARCGSKVVGGVYGEVRPWWDGNRLTALELFVDPKYQRKGLGRRLLGRVIQQAVLRYAIVAVDAVTFSRADFPVAWYRGLGFRVVDDQIVLSGKPPRLLQRLGSGHDENVTSSSAESHLNPARRKGAGLLSLGPQRERVGFQKLPAIQRSRPRSS